MDWVETTGTSVDEATQRALAHLGVHHNDAEIEVLEEPKSGLFGKIKGEARVRARVRPNTPRPKRQSRSGGRDNNRRNRNERSASSAPQKPEGRPEKEGNGNRRAQEKPRTEQRQPREKNMGEALALADQGKLGQEFLTGLLSAMNITADVTIREIDGETLEIAVNAMPPTELGVLVGPRGTTLSALQEVTRTYVQAKNPGRTDRILVDVAQYRERRTAALGRFATQVAEEVVETGEERALEPMSAADRKAVHDALTSNTAVVTRSEGDDPRRFVVIAPA